MRRNDIFVDPRVAVDMTVECIVGSLDTPYANLRRKEGIDFFNDLFNIVSHHDLEGYQVPSSMNSFVRACCPLKAALTVKSLQIWRILCLDRQRWPSR